ncbi:MAG: DoxX family membrane protein [Actinomycetota bacterium]|nr:DoxX family membrane protein [Actinomycetota bacterium]
MSERDPAAGGGSSPYDEPTGEIDLGAVASQRRRQVPSEERDTFYDRHAAAGRKRVDDLDDVEPDEVATRRFAPPAGETESMPTESAPTESMPTESMPTESMPTESMAAAPTPATEAIDRRPAGAVDRPPPAEEDATTPFAAPTSAGAADPTPPTTAFNAETAPPTTAYATDTSVVGDPDTYPAADSYPTSDERLRSVEEDLAESERRARRGTLDLGLLLLRVAVGLIAMAHGAQKLFGWWNGPRLSGFQDMLVNAPNPAIGFDAAAARPLAILGALSETLGGLMLVIGLFTPLAASAVLGVMLVAAAYKATLAGGLWFFAAGGAGAGIEYELLLAVCAGVIILTGPGRISVDAPRGWARRPSWGSLALLIVGVGAAVAVWLLFNGTNPFESPGNPTG